MKTESGKRPFFLAFWILFLIGNIWVFQPWVYDNIKLFVYWHIAGAIAVSGFLWATFGRPVDIRLRILFPVLCFILTFSGILSLTREATSGSSIFDLEDRALATWVREKTPPSAIFLSGDYHNNPVTSLAGRSVVMGYPGWLWSHGFDYSARQHHVGQIYKRASGFRELLKEYSVNYIVLGVREREKYGVKDQELQKSFPVAVKIGQYTVFENRLKI